MTKALSGKAALVTGGSRGIGEAIVKRLASEGADVAFSYVSSADKAQALVKSIEAGGGRALALKADQADAAQVEALVKKTIERFKRLDILVNNAGVYVMSTVGEAATDAAGLQRQNAINIGGVIAAVRAAGKVMGQGGRIISIGSALGSRTPWPGMADYSATKAAIAAYTRGCARDLGPKGITVNIVQPGPIDTEMNPENGNFSQMQKAMTALGRYGRPEEVAAAVAFLAGPEASYITGATLDVDGGFRA